MSTVERYIYLDHSATTPVDSRVVEAMVPYWSGFFGNSESSHAFGQAAANGLEQARQTVADVLNCRPAEILCHYLHIYKKNIILIPNSF